MGINKTASLQAFHNTRLSPTQRARLLPPTSVSEYTPWVKSSVFRHGLETAHDGAHAIMCNCLRWTSWQEGRRREKRGGGVLSSTSTFCSLGVQISVQLGDGQDTASVVAFNMRSALRIFMGFPPSEARTWSC